MTTAVAVAAAVLALATVVTSLPVVADLTQTTLAAAVVAAVAQAEVELRRVPARAAVVTALTTWAAGVEAARPLPHAAVASAVLRVAPREALPTPVKAGLAMSAPIALYLATVRAGQAAALVIVGSASLARATFAALMAPGKKTKALAVSALRFVRAASALSTTPAATRVGGPRAWWTSARARSTARRGVVTPTKIHRRSRTAAR